MRMALLIASGIFAAVAGGQGPVVGPPSMPGPPVIDTDALERAAMRKLPIDDLIERLPRVGAEGAYDEGKREYVCVPAVDEMESRLAKGEVLTETQWQRALTHTAIISFRAKWPAGQVIRVSMRDSAWLPWTEIRLQPRTSGLTNLRGGATYWEMCGVGLGLRLQEQTNQALGTLPIGKHHLVFDAQIERGEGFPERNASSAKPGMVWTGLLAFDVEVVPTLEDAMPRVDSPKVNDAVRRSLGLRRWAYHGASGVMLLFDADDAAAGLLATTALSMRVEVLRGEEVRAVQRLVANANNGQVSGHSVYDGPNPLFTWTYFTALQGGMLEDPAEMARWSLRVQGTSEDVLTLWHADKQWAGSFEIPLAEVIKQEKERMVGKPERSFVWMP